MGKLTSCRQVLPVVCRLCCIGKIRLDSGESLFGEMALAVREPRVVLIKSILWTGVNVDFF